MNDGVHPTGEGGAAPAEAAPGVNDRAPGRGYPVSRRRMLQVAAAAAAAGATSSFWQPTYAAQPAARGAAWADPFAQPAADSVPLILWFWNGTVTADLVDSTLAAEVTLNGVELPSRLWAPYRLDVTRALRGGANVLRVRVTNTGANAHGDAEASGLLGPVVLRPERVEDVRLSAVRH
jgi:hypothetical protein